MSFKDDLAADIDIFLNLDEFAETITLDEVTLSAVISEHTADKSARLSETFDGLYGDFTEIYFRASDYTATRERLPRQGEWAIYNGKRYDVISSENQGGVAHLILSAYRQNTLRRG